jgi:hypothetical protein
VVDVIYRKINTEYWRIFIVCYEIPQAFKFCETVCMNVWGKYGWANVKEQEEKGK